MKKTAYLFSVGVGVIFFFWGISLSCFAQSQTTNSISGFIYDAKNRTPVSDVYVELLNDVYSTLKRIKTDGSGRFLFTGLSAGTFKVKVLTYGTNYLEEVQDATIINYRFGSSVTSDSVYLDFYLKLDKRKINIYELPPTAVIFAQDIPQTAKELYKKATSQLEKPKENAAGLENLKKAIEIFPDYYDALDRLGIELVKRHQFYESIPYLVKSVSVNQRSFSSYYMLGLAAYNIKQIKEAIEAFKGATIINPESIQAYLQYGMVLRIDGRYKDAEQSLLKAISLSKDSSKTVIYWQLALLYEKMGRYNEAADELDKYLKSEPDVENSKQVKALIKSFREKAKLKTS